MNKIKAILTHTIEEGVRSGDDFIIEINADEATLGSARTIKWDDTFVRLNLDKVLGGPVDERLAIITDESVESRTVSYRVVDPDWREEGVRKSGHRQALELNSERDESNNGGRARIEFIRSRGDCLLTLADRGVVIEQESASLCNLSRLIGLAEKYIRNYEPSIKVTEELDEKQPA